MSCKKVIVSLFAFTLLFVGCKSAHFQRSLSDDVSAEEILAGLSLNEKIGQLFVISPDQLDLEISLNDVMSVKSVPHTFMSFQMEKTYSDYPAGGFILFAKNIKNPRQLKNFTRQINSVSKVRPIISIDEEGGRVVRIAKNNRFPVINVGPMQDIGKTGDIDYARRVGEYIGSYLSEYGFTMNFAPVADVNTNPENIVIGDRAFGSEPEKVSEMVGAFLQGLHSKGIAGCIKHFPGHGDTKDDTHADYVEVRKSWAELQNCELIPFKNNLKLVDSVMLAHVTLSALGPDSLPCSLSKNVVTGKLRKEMGFDGLILTDSLAMGAIEKNYGSEKAAILAIEAGNDILLMPYDYKAAYKAVVDAVITGKIPEERINESVLRILRFKGYR